MSAMEETPVDGPDGRADEGQAAVGQTDVGQTDVGQTDVGQTDVAQTDVAQTASNGHVAPPIDAAASTQPVDELPQETPPQPARDAKLCGVCHAQPGRYKCPRCQMPYCSVPCSKQHKENHPADLPPPPPSQPTTTAKRPQQPDPYAVLLDHAPEFTRLFAKYPTLPTVLSRIQRTTLPPADTHTSSSSATAPGGLPWKLGPEHLPGGGNRPKAAEEPWTRQAGLRKGAAALRRARVDPGEDGDAVREYCELVVFLLGEKGRRTTTTTGGDGLQGGGGGGVAVDVTALVGQEVVAEEAEVIRGLLAREREGGE